MSEAQAYQQMRRAMKRKIQSNQRTLSIWDRHRASVRGRRWYELANEVGLLTDLLNDYKVIQFPAAPTHQLSPHELEVYHRALALWMWHTGRSHG